MLLSCTVLLVADDVLAVPFYMYTGPAFDWIKNCSVKPDHADELENLRHQQHAAEVLFPERLENHPERELTTLSLTWVHS